MLTFKLWILSFFSGEKLQVFLFFFHCTKNQRTHHFPDLLLSWTAIHFVIRHKAMRNFDFAKNFLISSQSDIAFFLPIFSKLMKFWPEIVDSNGLFPYTYSLFCFQLLRYWRPSMGLFLIFVNYLDWKSINWSYFFFGCSLNMFFSLAGSQIGLSETWFNCLMHRVSLVLFRCPFFNFFVKKNVNLQLKDQTFYFVVL